jgi:hypothetical protein
MIPISNKDILKVKGKNTYIIQQCNCICTKPAGLAKDIGDVFPYAQPYSLPHRTPSSNPKISIEKDRDIPGTYKLFPNKNNEDDPIVVALFGQYDIGKVGKFYGIRPKDFDDSTENREKWFKQSLTSFGDYIKNKFNSDKIKINAYIPYNIGCGMAGGKWENYLNMINEFNETYKQYINLEIVQK